MTKFDYLVKACSTLLAECPDAQQARSYLDNRLDTKTQQKFGFGYHPTAQNLSLLDSLVDRDLLLELEIAYKDISYDGQISWKPSLGQHNLVMPYKNVYGNTIALVGRSLLPEDTRAALGISKYKNTAFKKSKHLFGLWEAKHSIIQQGFAYVVEGQFDCIKAHGNGITNVVAVGSSNMTMDQLALILRYTDQLHILFDNDEAGEAGRERIVEKYARYTNITNVNLPTGFKDLDEFLTDNPECNERQLRMALS